MEGSHRQTEKPWAVLHAATVYMELDISSASLVEHGRQTDMQ